MVILLKNAGIPVCCDKKWSVECHDIIIEDSKVLELDGKCVPDRCVDIGERLLLPQFFNIHCHLGESLYEIHGNDWTISKYLAYTSEITDNMIPSERDGFWQNSAEKTMRLLIKNGTGGFCAARSAEISKKYRLCTMAGYPLMLSRKLEQFHLEGLNGFTRYVRKNLSSRCCVGIFLHSLYKADEKLLDLAVNCFRNRAEFLTVHISEDPETRRLETARFGQEPAFVLDRLGLLTDRTILVHGGYLSGKELELIGKRKSLIAVCPVSNRFLNTACADVYALEKMGIRWCLATDGLATGRTLDLIEQAAVLKSRFPLLSGIKLLQSVTTVPARVFHRKIYTGMIQAGTESSFIMLRQRKADLKDEKNAEGSKAAAGIESILEKLFTGRLSWKAVRF